MRTGYNQQKKKKQENNNNNNNKLPDILGLFSVLSTGSERQKNQLRIGHLRHRLQLLLTAITLKQSGGWAPAPCKSFKHNCTSSSIKSSAKITFPRALTTQTNEKDDGICGMPYIYTCLTHLKVRQQNNITSIWYIAVFVKEAGAGSDPAKKCMLTHSCKEVWCQQSLHEWEHHKHCSYSHLKENCLRQIS